MSTVKCTPKWRLSNSNHEQLVIKLMHSARLILPQPSFFTQLQEIKGANSIMSITKTNLCFFILQTLLLFSVLFIARAFDDEVEDENLFNYVDGDPKGPSNWGKIHPNWAACGNGTHQSPIDLIRGGVSFVSSSGKLQLNYKPANATVKISGYKLTTNWAEDAGYINLEGNRYNLTKARYHINAEHALASTRPDMELQLIHAGANQTVIVAVLHKISDNHDPFLARLTSPLSSVGKEEKSVGTLDASVVNVRTQDFFDYVGSLTAPPCTENVRWVVQKEMRPVSKEQVDEMKKAINGTSTNSRVLQRRNGRDIQLFVVSQAVNP